MRNQPENQLIKEICDWWISLLFTISGELYKLGLFGMLKLELALQFLLTNAYFSVHAIAFVKLT